MRGEYLLLLAASLGSVLWLDRFKQLGVFRQWRRLLAALVPIEVAILAWDILGVERWGWWSNKAVLAGPYAFGDRIPLEELLFPIVVGACALTLWELVKTWEVASGKVAGSPAASAPNRQRVVHPADLLPPSALRIAPSAMLRWEYLLSGIIACAVVLALDQALGTRLARRRRFWIYLGIMIVCQLIFDGYLTARPVTLYDPCCYLGTRLPLIAMPVEEFFFGLAMVGLAAVLWEWSGDRVGRRPDHQEHTR